MSTQQLNPIQLQTTGQSQVDPAAWNQTLVQRIGIAFSSLVNEFARCVQFICNPTQATASYEKCFDIIEGEQHDPSDYAKGILKDAVGHSSCMSIGGNIQTGRSWAQYLDNGCQPGSDGLVTVSERGGKNFGSAQPTLATPTSKVVDAIVAGELPGCNPMTAARVIVAGTAKFFMGDVAFRNAFVDQDSAVVSGVMDNDGTFAYSVTARGDVNAKRINAKEFGFPFINSDTIPQIPAGTMAMWGNTKTGETRLIFFDGGHFFEFVPTVTA